MDTYLSLAWSVFTEYNLEPLQNGSYSVAWVRVPTDERHSQAISLLAIITSQFNSRPTAFTEWIASIALHVRLRKWFVCVECCAVFFYRNSSHHRTITQIEAELKRKFYTHGTSTATHTQRVFFLCIHYMCYRSTFLLLPFNDREFSFRCSFHMSVWPLKRNCLLTYRFHF